MSKSPQILAKNLRRLVEATKLTHREIAARAKLPQSGVTNYVNGKITPSIETLDRLADALGVTASQLLTDPDAPSAQPLVIRPTVEESLTLVLDLLGHLRKETTDPDSPIVRQVKAWLESDDE